MEQELSIAAEIQSNLMPRESPKLLGYEIAARNLPSRVIGGDFYDLILFDQSHLGIVIADVSGKGIPGAILMASARASLRAYLEEPHNVEEVITKLNLVLCRDIQSGQFVSLFYGMLDMPDRTLTYINAGHNAPVLFRDGKMILLQQGGPILGILQDASYKKESIQLLSGDVVLLYTDGVTEAEGNNTYFGEERLLELVRANMSRSADELVNKVLDEVAEFTASLHQSDDRTIIVLRKLP